MRKLYLQSPRYLCLCGDAQSAGDLSSDVFGMMFAERERERERRDQAVTHRSRTISFTLARIETINQSASKIATPTETSGVAVVRFSTHPRDAKNVNPHKLYFIVFINL